MRKRNRYSDFCQMLSRDDGGRFTLVVGYNDFEIWMDDRTGRMYYLEVSDNDASDFFEVRQIAELKYNAVKTELKADGPQLGAMFDCCCCGEAFAGETYLWFEKAGRTIMPKEDVRDD